MKVWGLKFGGWGPGFRVQGPRCGVQSPGLGCSNAGGNTGGHAASVDLAGHYKTGVPRL